MLSHDTIKALAHQRAQAFLIVTAFIVLFVAFPGFACNETNCSIDILPTNNQIVAVANGNWDVAATWNLGRIPAPGDNVVIPSGRKVTWTNNYQMSATSAPIRSIKVEGELSFVPFWSARLVVDTIVVSNTGKFNIASSTRPMDNNKFVEILFAGGDLDLARDPNLKGRGLVSHGSVQIHGQHKTSWLRLVDGAAAISADQKTLTLASIPTNWKVNDRVLITGSRRTPKTHGVDYTLESYTTQDEVRKIHTISGNLITLDLPLTSGFHTQDFPGMPICVANMERNVRFATAAANTSTRHRRGHLMFMSSQNVTIQGASMVNLGRSNKSDPLTEIGSSVTANMKGRYPIHFHQIDQKSDGVIGNQTAPVNLKNCFIQNSPGFGVALHSTYGVIEDNVTFEVFASHFVAEDGDERGAMRRNLAVKSVGDTRGIKTFSTIDTNGKAFQDDGQRGHGFWFQSRNMEIEDNIAVSHGDEAFVYFHRHVATKNTPIDFLLTEHREVFRLYKTSLTRDDVPIVVSRRNIGVASSKAMHVIKANNDQGHDIRNLFENWGAYNVDTGYEVQYTGEYTFRDFVAYRSDTESVYSAGYLHGNKVIDMVHVRPVSHGWRRAFVAGDEFSGTRDAGNILFVAGQVKESGQASAVPFQVSQHLWKAEDETDGGVRWHIPSIHQVASYNQNMNLDASYTLPPPTLATPIRAAVGGIPANLWAGYKLTVSGTKNDSAGAMAVDAAHPSSFSFRSIWSGSTLRPVVEGQSTYANGKRYIQLTDHAADRVSGKVRIFNYQVEITPYVAQ